jgi:hypothetical protein
VPQWVITLDIASQWKIPPWQVEDELSKEWYDRYVVYQTERRKAQEKETKKNTGSKNKMSWSVDDLER